ncbi:MAG: hypothetical protein IT531_01420 [Burkholderiales bacterium]|nr:hypothetical protein [Burkholderiales bacterium]
MGSEAMQGVILVLLAVIAVAVVAAAVVAARILSALHKQVQESHVLFSARDPGPVLHSLVQQTRDVNRLLANIDKRLEKLEALEKVQIANLSFRDEAARGTRQ